MLELAIREGKGPVSLKDIAQNQEISLQYLEHLITPLISGGLVKSTRGARGGVSLAKPAKDIRLSDIINLLEGSNAPVECVDKPETCSRAHACATRDVWVNMKDAVDQGLAAITLKDLAEKQKRKEQTDEVMYYI